MRRLLLAAAALSVAWAAPALANNGKQVGLGKNVTVTTDANAAAAKKAAKDDADAKAAAKAKADQEAAEKQAAALAAAQAAREADEASRAQAEADAAAAAEAAAAAAAAASEASQKSQQAKATHQEHETAAADRANAARQAAFARVSGASSSGGDPSIPVPDSTITFLMGGADQEFAVDYTGYVEEQVAPGLAGFGHFRFLGSADGITWDFAIVSLENISTSPITASRLSGYGFNVNPDAKEVTATGLFNSVAYNGTVPMLGNREICIKTIDNPSCAGYGGGGLKLGESTTIGGFSIILSASASSLTLDKFFVRFQEIAGAPGGDSGVGTGVVSPVPEPAEWAMLLTGFLVMGTVLRRRRAAPLAAAA